MGTLISFAIISLFAGMYSLATSLNEGGTGGFFWVVAIILNLAVVIRMLYERIRRKDKRFRTGQLVYIVGIIVAAISWVILLCSKITEENFAIVTLLLGLCPALWTVIFNVGGQYLVCFLNTRNKPEESPFDQFFLPTGESREIQKHLRSFFGWAGVILIAVAVCLLVIGILDSGDSVPSYSYSNCYKCDNVGRYVQNGKLVTCTACNGAGYIANKLSNDSGNIMTGIALLFGALGAGSIVMTKALKDKES